MNCMICGHVHDIGLECQKINKFMNSSLNVNLIQQLADKQAQISELMAKVDELHHRVCHLENMISSKRTFG